MRLETLTRDALTAVARRRVSFPFPSHMRTVYEAAAPENDAESAFANLEALAPICGELGIETVAVVPLDLKNAPHLDAMIDFLADHGVTGLRVTHPANAGHFDALAVLSDGWLKWKFDAVRTKAEARGVKLESEIPGL